MAERIRQAATSYSDKKMNTNSERTWRTGSSCLQGGSVAYFRRGCTYALLIERVQFNLRFGSGNWKKVL